jgi:hypothetical protein
MLTDIQIKFNVLRATFNNIVNSFNLLMFNVAAGHQSLDNVPFCLCKSLQRICSTCIKTASNIFYSTSLLIGLKEMYCLTVVL